jgi:flagellar motor switch/type III secretory pathway protein FliN
MSRPVTPLAIGGNATSVERLLSLRTAAEGSLDAVTISMGASFRRQDLVVAVTGVSGGAKEDDDARLLALESDTGTLGHVLVGPELTIGLADLVMGGTGMTEERAPTSLELDLVMKRLVLALRPLLSAVAPGRGELTRIEPVETRDVGRATTVQLEVRMGDQVCPVTLEVLERQILRNSGADKVSMQKVCQHVEVELQVWLDALTMRTADLATLQPGDVLCLEHDANKPLTCTVDGQEVFRASLGRHRSRVAVQVVDAIEGEI